MKNEDGCSLKKQSHLQTHLLYRCSYLQQLQPGTGPLGAVRHFRSVFWTCLMVDLSCLRPGLGHPSTHKGMFLLSINGTSDVFQWCFSACQASCLCGSTHHSTGTKFCTLIGSSSSDLPKNPLGVWCLHPSKCLKTTLFSLVTPVGISVVTKIQSLLSHIYIYFSCMYMYMFDSGIVFICVSL